MLPVRGYTKSGQPYVEDMSDGSTAYANFASRICEVITGAVHEWMSGGDGRDAEQRMTRYLMAELKEPYTEVLAYEYKVVKGSSEGDWPHEAMPPNHHITNLVS